MMLHIPGVLSADEVRELRGQLDPADWSDGRATAGVQGAKVKSNLQLDPAMPLAQALSRRILEKLRGHQQFFAATLPLRILPPQFNRYADGGQFRSDCACTRRSDIQSVPRRANDPQQPGKRTIAFTGGGWGGRSGRFGLAESVFTHYQGDKEVVTCRPISSSKPKR